LYIGWQLPDTYKNADEIPVSVILVDQWDYPHTATLQVPLHRLSTRAKAIKKSARIPLFSPDDDGAPILSVEPPRPTAESREKDGRAMRRSLEEAVRVNSISE
jgi:hypothetical protein